MHAGAWSYRISTSKVDPGRPERNPNSSIPLGGSSSSGDNSNASRNPSDAGWLGVRAARRVGHGVSFRGGNRARAGLAGTRLGGELGADAAGIGVIDLLEDPQGPRPGPAGGAGVARAEVHIAEAGEGTGLGAR